MRQRFSIKGLIVVLAIMLTVLSAGVAWARVVCDSCGNTIVSKYYQVQGRNLCPSCYEKQLPRCGKCHQILRGKYYEDKEGHYCCEACRQKAAPLCACCGKRILDRSWKVFRDRATACNSCVKEYPACSVCLLPSGGGCKLYDGRALCAKHKKQAIMDKNAARSVYAEAERKTMATFGPRVCPKYDTSDFRLVGIGDLERVMGSSDGRNNLGCCLTTIYPFKYKHDIYVLYGLPAELLVSVFVHERAHAWHNESNPNLKKASGRFKEGFAQWVAYKVQQRFGGKSELERMDNDSSSEYGGGLKDFLNYEKKYGLEGVLQAAKSKTSL